MFPGKRATAILFILILSFIFCTGHALGAREKTSLAIFNFRPTNIEAMGYNGDILYALISALGMDGSIELMSRRQMEEILFQEGMSQSDDPDMALKAGKSLGVNFILFGQVTKNGADILSNINLLDVKARRVVKSWSLTFSGRESILDRIPVYAKELISNIKNADQYSPAASTREKTVDIENLRVASEGKSVVLNWKFDPSHPIRAFNIYRSENEGGPYQSIGKVNKNSFKDKKIRVGRTYYYRIGILLNSGTEQKSSHTAMIRNAGEKVPYPPLMISCKGYVRRAELKFVPSLENDKDNFKIEYYEIFRREEPDGHFEKIMTVEKQGRSKYDLSFIVEDIQGLSDGSEYSYRISSVDRKDRRSPMSDTFTITTVKRPILRLEKDDLLRKITLSWDPLDNINGYYLYRKTQGKEWEVIDKITGSGSTRYNDEKKLTDQMEYYYYLTAYDEKGETGASKTVKGKTKDLPAPPMGVTAKSGMVKSVWISWSPIDDPDIGGYSIYRGRSSKGLDLVNKVKGYTSLSYLDKGTAFSPLEDGTRYYYAVVSYNLYGVEGEPSEAVTATTKHRPSRVSGITAAISESNNILVKWDENPEPDISSYILYRSKNGGYWSKIQTLGSHQSSYRDYDLQPDISYQYRIIAVDKDDLKSDPAKSEPVLSPLAPQ